MTGPGKYELLDRIAKGGMAELYRGRVVGAEGFSKVLAIKRILPGFADDQAFVSMLIDEARVVANLAHPNIVQVFELGKDPAGYFIAMEFVNGPNLGALLKRLQDQGRRLPEPIALDVIIAVLQALDFAHRLTDAAGRAQNLVHRDVSPQNVLVSDAGAVKLGDFGIAKATHRVAVATQAGSIKGKVPYMAPEQLRGEAVDGRTDQFAAGLVLWECLAGRRHYQGPNELELMRQVNAAQILPLADFGVEVSPELEAILLRSLSADPEARYPSCAEMARELTVYHRRTYPAHDPEALANLVKELFAPQLEALNERLRRFEAGEELPSGWAGAVEVAQLDSPALLTEPATDPTRTAEDPDAIVTVGPPNRGGRSRTGEQGAAMRTRTGERSAAGRSRTGEQSARRPSSVSNRAPAPAPAPIRTPVDSPAVPAARERAAEESRAIDAALAAEKSREKSERKKGPGPVGLVLAFVLAAGAVYVIGALSQGSDLAPTALEPSAAALKDLPPPEPIVPPGATERAEPAPRAEPRPAAGSRTRKAGASKGGHGTLDVDCKPECRIEIDGRDTGLTAPARGIVLDAGKHRLRASNRMLNLSKTVTIEIQAGERTYRELNLVLDP